MFRVKSFGINLSAIIIALGVIDASPARADQMDRLLALLVKKHVITEREATSLREEVQRDKPAEQAQAVIEKHNDEPRRKEQAVTGSTKIKFSGWAQTRFTHGANTATPFSSLELRRARLVAEGTLTPQFGYKMEIDAVRSPVLLDARLDYSYKPYAKVTAGQFKIPFSQENLDSDRDVVFIERSLVGLSLAPGRDTGNNGRDIGAQLAGNVLAGNGRPIFDYAVGFFNGAGVNRRDDNRRKDVAARLAVHPLSGLSLTGDYYNGASGDKEISKERAGVELAYVRKLYSFRGEYIWGHDGPVRKYGWYGQFVYRFRPKWEALARFDTYDPKRHAGKDTTNTYLFGVNWYLLNWVKLQANYGVVDEENRTNLTNLFLSQVQFQF